MVREGVNRDSRWEGEIPRKVSSIVSSVLASGKLWEGVKKMSLGTRSDVYTYEHFHLTLSKSVDNITQIRNLNHEGVKILTPSLHEGN